MNDRCEAEPSSTQNDIGEPGWNLLLFELLLTLSSVVDNNSDGMDDIESEDEPESQDLLRLLSDDSQKYNTFIEVYHHPHSGKDTPTVIPLDDPTKIHSSPHSVKPLIASAKPWAPFRTHADFEFAELAVTECLSKMAINRILKGYHDHWAKKTTITFKGHSDLQASLSAAR